MSVRYSFKQKYLFEKAFSRLKQKLRIGISQLYLSLLSCQRVTITTSLIKPVRFVTLNDFFD
jgi:hypothetical protein